MISRCRATIEPGTPNVWDGRDNYGSGGRCVARARTPLSCHVPDAQHSSTLHTHGHAGSARACTRVGRSRHGSRLMMVL